MFPSAVDQDVCQYAFKLSGKMCATPHQCRSEESSNRNTTKRDLLFTGLEYRCMLPTHVLTAGKRKDTENIRWRKHLPKRLFKADYGKWNFGCWRTTYVSKLVVALLASKIFSFKQQVPGGHLRLLKHGFAANGLHEVMGSLLKASGSSRASSAPPWRTIATLARL